MGLHTVAALSSHGRLSGMLEESPDDLPIVEYCTLLWEDDRVDVGLRCVRCFSRISITSAFSRGLPRTSFIPAVK